VRRIKLILAAAAAVMVLMVVAAPAMANDLDRACFPFCDGHNLGHHHTNDDFFIDEFDEFDEVFVELEDCEFVGFDGDEAIFVCEVDFD
jgi:hypothetical protein